MFLCALGRRRIGEGRASEKLQESHVEGLGSVEDISFKRAVRLELAHIYLTNFYRGEDSDAASSNAAKNLSGQGGKKGGPLKVSSGSVPDWEGGKRVTDL